MKNDEKLDEVKEILRRLQRINTGEEDGAARNAAGSASSSDEGSRRAWSRHETTTPENRAKIVPSAAHGPAAAETAAPLRRGAMNGKLEAAGISALLLALVLAFALWPEASREPQPKPVADLGDEQPTSAGSERETTIAAVTPPAQPSSTGSAAETLPPKPIDPDAERIAQAQQLIDEGKILAARDMLLGGLGEQSSQAALMLARSYDPNSLLLIPNADAAPDIEAAERWYRRWHDMAARDGLALDQYRLDRIIKAMK